jgi:diacylglycerol kinase (ATP)
MKNPNDNFLIGRLKSIKYAFKGIYLLITTEHSVMVQFSLGIIVIIFGFVMNISATEWMFQLLAIGLVLVAESLNTGIEKLCDFVHIEYNDKIGFIKDISAGASTFAVIIAIVIGLIIYIPKFI